MNDELKQDEPGESSEPSITAQSVEYPLLDDGTVLEPDDQAREMNLSRILDIPVDVHVEVGQTHVSIRDVLRLGVGAIVELDKLAGASADIIVNGKLIGQGDVVVINENFGVRITRLVEPEQRIESL